MPGYPIRDDEYFRTPSELFYALVRRSGRPRTVRRQGQSDFEYYRAEIEAGTPEHPPPSEED